MTKSESDSPPNTESRNLLRDIFILIIFARCCFFLNLYTHHASARRSQSLIARQKIVRRFVRFRVATGEFLLGHGFPRSRISLLIRFPGAGAKFGDKTTSLRFNQIRRGGHVVTFAVFSLIVLLGECLCSSWCLWVVFVGGICAWCLYVVFLGGVCRWYLCVVFVGCVCGWFLRVMSVCGVCVLCLCMLFPDGVYEWCLCVVFAGDACAGGLCVVSVGGVCMFVMWTAHVETE